MSKIKSVETESEWETALQNLFQQIGKWAERQRNWSINSAVTETELPNSTEWHPKYGMVIDIGRNRSNRGDRVHLEPLGHRADGKGVVELMAWPTLVRVRLLHTPGEAEWDVVTSEGIPLRRDWNEYNFVQLVNDLLSVA